MIGALIIVLREVIEAGLIIGIVLAVTTNIPRRMPYIFGGLAAGLLGSALVATFAEKISSLLEGTGQEVFNASILLLATAMLTWHNVWMARHGRQMAEELREVGRAVTSGRRSLLALAMVIGLAVLREGSEVVLFLYGIVISDGGAGWQLLAGGLIGLALGICVSVLTFAGLIALPVGLLFRVTSLLIAFMAAGMAAQAIGFLEQADIANMFTRVVWNTSAFISENSMAGRILHTLLGYTDRPTQMQLFVYLGTLIVTFILMRLVSPQRKDTPRLATS
jgi:high-affinity iron transporter